MISVSLVALLLSAEPSTAAAATDVHPFARRAIIPFAIGGGLFIAGGLFLGVSVAQTNAAAKLDGMARDDLNFIATNNRVGGILLMVAGALTAGVATILFTFEPVPGVALSLTPTPGGAFLGLTWAVP